MTDERYKALMEQVGMPNSRSLLGALQQVANEVGQEVRAALAQPPAPDYKALWESATEANKQLARRAAQPPEPTAQPVFVDHPCVPTGFVDHEMETVSDNAAQPAAPFLFIAMDDDRRASVTWCANEAAVREAAKRSMFWLQPGEQLSAEHANELDGCVDELLESGAMHFEGDPPLYLYRVGNVAQPVQQPGAADLLHALKLISAQDQGCGGNVTEAEAWRSAQSIALKAIANYGKQAAPARRQPLSDAEIEAAAPAKRDSEHWFKHGARWAEKNRAAAWGVTLAAQKGEKL